MLASKFCGETFLIFGMSDLLLTNKRLTEPDRMIPNFSTWKEIILNDLK